MSEDFENHLRIYVPKDMSLDEGWELEALLRTVEEAMKVAKTGKDGEIFQMVVEVPAALDRDELDKLFEAVATAAHDIEERFPNRTWDVFVAGGVLHEDHSPEAAFRRVFDEREGLQEQLAEAKQINEDWVAYKGRVTRREEGWRRALVAALGLEESAPLPEMDELIGRATVQRAGGEQWKSELDLAKQRLEAIQTEMRNRLERR